MTVIMGVVNVTADSFSDGGRYLDADAAITHGLALRAAGADILDIGGESTRPGAQRVDAATERDRVLPVIAALVREGAVASIDTMNADTARAAVAAGARIVNDVSGGLGDPDMLPAIAATGADVVLQHWRGHSADMYARAEYTDVVAEVCDELSARIAAARHAGIATDRIVVDPGIGFGKHGGQNWEVLRGLERIVALGPRVLVGTSRKRFLGELFRDEQTAGEQTAGERGSGERRGDDGHRGRRAAADVDVARKDLATAVTSVLAARAGAWGVRVHDVPATRDALAVLRAWEGQG